jgi:hypothetical protein
MAPIVYHRYDKLKTPNGTYYLLWYDKMKPNFDLMALIIYYMKQLMHYSKIKVAETTSYMLTMAQSATTIPNLVFPSTHIHT